ncbi:hypothetical protein BGZ82_003823 [Podila clonocystis]|nr:hypothetical protein BGZ82_003823 [Podila clonocystis]
MSKLHSRHYSRALVLAVLLLLASMMLVTALKCGVNEEVKAVGFDCATCDNARCVRCASLPGPRCFCMDGYIRASSGGACIPMESCPYNCKSCSLNQPEAC